MLHVNLPCISELSLISLHWFLTLFASVVHMKVLLRLWDLFFYEGSTVLFQMTIGMLKMKVGSSVETINALVPNTVCQRRSHESITTPLGSLLLRGINGSLPDDHWHAENEGT